VKQGILRQKFAGFPDDSSQIRKTLPDFIGIRCYYFAGVLLNCRAESALLFFSGHTSVHLLSDVANDE